MKKFKYALTSIFVAVFTVIIVQSSQQWTDNCYEATHVADTDLQNMENNFAALKTNFSGASSPSDVDGSQWWADTSNHILKFRNEADSAWLEVWDLANDRPMGLDAPGEIGGATPGDATFVVLALQSNTESLSGNKTISTGDPQIQFLDPDGADRDVTLPAEASNDGITYAIVNTGSEKLVVKDDGGSEIATIQLNRSGIFACDGLSWEVAGISTSEGGPAGGMLPFAESSGDTTYYKNSTSWTTAVTFQLYIPEINAGKIYMKPRLKQSSSGTGYCRFVVNTTNSAESSHSSTTYAWKSEIACDVSGESSGWTTLSIQLKSSIEANVYLQGFSFRWGG